MSFNALVDHSVHLHAHLSVPNLCATIPMSGALRCRPRAWKLIGANSPHQEEAHGKPSQVYLLGTCRHIQTNSDTITDILFAEAEVFAQILSALFGRAVFAQPVLPDGTTA